jgi:hypothetical protein
VAKPRPPFQQSKSVKSCPPLTWPWLCANFLV